MGKYTALSILPFPLQPTILTPISPTNHSKQGAQKMGLSRVNRVTVTIANGATASNVISSWNTYGGSAGIMIYSPATLPETVKIEVSADTSSTPTNWRNLQDGAVLADLTVPAANKAQYYERLVLANHVRFVSTAAVGAERNFSITFQAIYN